MSTDRPSPAKKRSPSSEVAELRLQLADRERRLAELTEQSLQVLDRLAAAREVSSERTALHARIAELQEVLADTRRRIRLGTRAVLGGDPDAQARCEIAVWGFGQGGAASLDALIAGASGEPVTALLGPGHRAEDFRRPDAAALSVQETECRSPAHYWNEAMAATQAEVVVLVAAGASLTAAALDRLAAVAAADGIAIASPCLVHGQSRALGRAERSLLDLVPHVAAATAEVEAIAFASPEAFAIARSAFHQLGPFDQDIAGDLALAEWTLRAAPRSLRCVGVAGAEVAIPAFRDGGDAAAIESDRLVILARHRPQQVATAALAAESLWQQEPMAVAAALRAAFRRLPHAGELTAAVDLLVVQAQTIAGWKRLGPALRERLRALAGELRVPVDGAVSDPGLLSLVERVQVAAAVLRERTGELEGCGQESVELRRQVAAHDVTVRELKDEIIARSGTIDSLRNELLERERAIASLREEVGHAHGDRDRLIDHLSHLQQEHDKLVQDLHAARAKLQEAEARAVELARLRERLAAVEKQVAAEQERTRETERVLGVERERVRETEHGLEAERERTRETERQLAVERERVRESERRHGAEQERAREIELRLASEHERALEIERQLGNAMGRTLELDPQLAAAKVGLQQLEQALGDESKRLQSVLGEIDDLRGGHETLRREHGSLQEHRIELEARAHELVLALRDRERWIADLLHEVRQRRLRRRELEPHEAEFLARHGQVPKA